VPISNAGRAVFSPRRQDQEGLAVSWEVLTMQSRISVKLTTAGEWLPAILTDERAESSYGLPVVVVEGQDFARGTGELAAVRVSAAVDPELIDAARRAGFRLVEMPNKKGAQHDR
jgi:hypothetical protein